MLLLSANEVGDLVVVKRVGGGMGCAVDVVGIVVKVQEYDCGVGRVKGMIRSLLLLDSGGMLVWYPESSCEEWR